MGQPHNYVVRIYRRGFASLEGLIEDSRTGNEQPFSSIEQLWALLRGPIRRKPQRREDDPNYRGVSARKRQRTSQGES